MISRLPVVGPDADEDDPVLGRAVAYLLDQANGRFSWKHDPNCAVLKQVLEKIPEVGYHVFYLGYAAACLIILEDLEDMTVEAGEADKDSAYIKGAEAGVRGMAECLEHILLHAIRETASRTAPPALLKEFAGNLKESERLKVQ